MHMTKNMVATAVLAAAFGASGQALATEPGDWLFRVGASTVSPNDGSSGVVPDDDVEVDDGSSLTFSFTYMFEKNMGVEILAALPFEHDIDLDGVGKIAEIEHLPPTVSFEYHFKPDSDVRPYAGVGINYTTFMNEDEKAVITDIDLDDSTGLAVHGGVDIDINKDWFFNASLRYIDIETTADTNLGDIDVDIDPWVYTLGVGTTF